MLLSNCEEKFKFLNDILKKINNIFNLYLIFINDIYKEKGLFQISILDI
jgi:hypothetical protein